jgi:hypothetical protein
LRGTVRAGNVKVRALVLVLDHVTRFKPDPYPPAARKGLRIVCAILAVPVTYFFGLVLSLGLAALSAFLTLVPLIIYFFVLISLAYVCRMTSERMGALLGLAAGVLLRPNSPH